MGVKKPTPFFDSLLSFVIEFEVQGRDHCQLAFFVSRCVYYDMLGIVEKWGQCRQVAKT